MLERGIKLLPLQGVTNERALTQGVSEHLLKKRTSNLRQKSLDDFIT